ncbi:MAG TPA: ABC transporter ATP-binding protein [Chloroflexi bacterium]|nr:ABC transporter ATP-binding protein [Chloroflexota bacterium]
MNAIETHHLTKRYNGLTAVDDLSLTVPQGALFGFIGPNGAGKTTTLRMLAGLLEPTSGEIILAGEPITRNPGAARWVVGYMPDFFGVYEDMKVWEYLDFFARCYGLPDARRRSVVEELLHLVDLDDKREAFVESLSRGMRQRLCLAHALVHDPRILLLDEPASGLDPRARVEMRELLRELGRMGKTIVISSHILSELAEMSDAIGIIERGKLLAAGPVAEVVAAARSGKLLRIELLTSDAETLAGARGALGDVPGVVEVFDVAGGLEVAFSGDEAAMAGLLRHLVEHGVPVLHFGEATSNLEDVFLQITKGEVQ